MHNAGMIYGYDRVSTDSQDPTSQLAQLKAAGCEKVFRVKITGTTADRPQLRKLMAALTHGDVVIIPAVDRLSRPVAPAPMPRHHRGGGGDAVLALDRHPIRAHPPLLAACLYFARHWIAPPNSSNFSVNVVAAASGCG
jgi:Resolvase, N terminal domain